ncbi:hypothetical protein NDU88_006745 [Pleurodeles waltl]|uniref:Uncharacterized protein n=1 Tax=Pleurodeles waltl TaxID=8319 RepID=A0AAV7WBG3_PLEWA|nr:hypothetical protein NDU88_006745 [Pleurodeles waltl]
MGHPRSSCEPCDSVPSKQEHASVHTQLLQAAHQETVSKPRNPAVNKDSADTLSSDAYEAQYLRSDLTGGGPPVNKAWRRAHTPASPRGDQTARRAPQAAPPIQPPGEEAGQQNPRSAARPGTNPGLLGLCRNRPAADRPVQGNPSSRPRPAHRARATALQSPNDGKAAVRRDRRSGHRREALAPPFYSLQHRWKQRCGKQRCPAGPANQSCEAGKRRDHQRHRPHRAARPVS